MLMKAGDSPPRPEVLVEPRWTSTDTWIVCALTIAALVTRFWHLGYPPTLIFDEGVTVPLGRDYLRYQAYAETHPPLTSLLIAMGIFMFGDNAFAWRFAGATVGTAMIPLTYLLGKRLFKSRLAATCAAFFVLTDGLFLVDSRTAVWEIFYVFFGAVAYLFLFRFAQSNEPAVRRRSLVGMGVMLGLCLASKQFIPILTELFVLTCLIVSIVQHVNPGSIGLRSDRKLLIPMRWITGALVLVAGSSGLVFTACHLPNYCFGAWPSAAVQVEFYRQLVHAQVVFGRAVTSPSSSRWWTWPLMLRPMFYWKGIGPPGGTVSAIRLIGNPVIWWSVLVAVLLLPIQVLLKRSPERMFLLAGYIVYLFIWLAVPRFAYVYHYMPALYLGMLALAADLAECWEDSLEYWTQIPILMSLTPPIIFAFVTPVGVVIAVLAAATYLLLRVRSTGYAGKFVCILFVVAVAMAFGYFLPLWYGLPLSQSAYSARMWLHGKGVANWR